MFISIFKYRNSLHYVAVRVKKQQ